MPAAGFETAIPAGERPQTHAWDRSATGIGSVEVVKLFLHTLLANDEENTRWFKYDRDYLCVNKSQFVPVIFEPPCIIAIVNISTSFTQSQQTKKTRHLYHHDQPQAPQEPDLQTEYLPSLTKRRPLPVPHYRNFPICDCSEIFK